MAVRYVTVAKEASAEQTIEKSVFIAHIKSVSSKDEADAFVRSVRAQYKDATHNVPAFVIGEKMQLQWGSDDGEPQGTSGAPIVQLLVKEGLTNVCVVVTRYFGGIKLGTGGLVRAYTSSAKLAIEAAGRREVRDSVILDAEIGYPALDRVRKAAEGGKFALRGAEYGEKVRISVSFSPERESEVLALLSDITSGAFTVTGREETAE